MLLSGTVYEIGDVVVDHHARIVGDGLVLRVENRQVLREVPLYADVMVLTDNHISDYYEMVAEVRRLREIMALVARVDTDAMAKAMRR